MPAATLDKILFVIFFPVHLILFLIPKYLDRPVPNKKMFITLFLSLGLLCACIFLLDWWVYEISRGSGIPIDILGIILLGIGLSIEFMSHNIKVIFHKMKL